MTRAHVFRSAGAVRRICPCNFPDFLYFAPARPRKFEGGSVPPDNGFTRRQFIGASTAMLALPAMRRAQSMSRSRPTPYRAIYDERFVAGLEFARDAAGRGWITRAIRGDVTQ